MKQKTALVLGAGGFIGSHMANKLKQNGYWVRGADLKYPEFSKSSCDEFFLGDLRERDFVAKMMLIGRRHNYLVGSPDNQDSFDEVYQFAADMGGALFVFSGDNDADIMHNSALINLNVVNCAIEMSVKKIFYSSSACIYPQQIQESTDNKGLKESDAYPVNPDSEYGYEKIFSERLYDAYRRNCGLNIRVARFHNIFGIEGTYEGGREKSPAALTRKVAEAKNGGVIEVWGDGLQTRSFLSVDECVEGIRRLMESSYTSPINLGSDEIISINQFAQMIIDISGKKLTIKNIWSNALGVRGRNSDNTLIKEILNWAPSQPLRVGIEKLYYWVNKQVNG